MQYPVTASIHSRRLQSDADYLRRVLQLANWQEGDDLSRLREGLLDALAVPPGDGGKMPEHSVLERHGKALAGEIATVVAAVLRKRPDRQLNQEMASRLAEVQVYGRIRIDDKGRLIHEHHYFPGSPQAAAALVWGLLSDPDRPFGRSLRSCRFRGCKSIFLDVRAGLKGQPRRYCEEHAGPAARAATRKRVAAYRERERHAKHK